MIKVEPCLRCGRITYTDNVGGPVIKTDTEPLEAEPAVQALVAGRTLYRITRIGKRPANFGTATAAVLGKLRTEPGERPIVVQEHRCAPAGRPRTPSPVDAETGIPERPAEGRTRPFARALPASPTREAAPRAETPDSEGPRCEDCGQIMADGTYASVQLGDACMWAAHLTDCG